jgi:enoyl-CoA hydratase/carnithine racemase
MTVHYEADGSVVIITIDRPEVSNAIDRPTADALADAMRRFDADPGLSVAVLTGAGGKFCAGADLKAMNEPTRRRVTTDHTKSNIQGYQSVLFSRPTVLANSGSVMGQCWTLIGTRPGRHRRHASGGRSVPPRRRAPAARTVAPRAS